MPEVAALTVSISANTTPFEQGLARLNARFIEFQSQAVAAGKALDAAFAGETAKQTKLAQALDATAASLAKIQAAGTGAGQSLASVSGGQAISGQKQLADALSQTTQKVNELQKSASADVFKNFNGAPIVPALPSLPGVETGGASAGILGFAQQAGAAISGFVSNALASLDRLGQGMQHVGGILSLAVTAPLIKMGKETLSAAGDFEQGGDIMQASLHLTDAQMKEVSALAIKLGADITLPSTSALDAATAIQTLAQSGVSLKDSMAAARSTLQLSAVAMISNKEAAEDVASVLNAYHLAGTDAAHVTDVLAGGMLNSKLTVNDFTAGLANAAPVATQLGHSLDDVSTAITLSARAGMSGAEAGTAYRTMMMRLAAPTNTASELMQRFGMNFRDANGHIKNITGIIAELNRTLGPNATMVRAVGGDVDEMNKKLAEAEKRFKAAQKVIADMPSTLAVQNARLADLQHKLTEVDEPAQKLTTSIAHQKAEIGLATAEMIRHNQEGLRKLGEENLLARDRVNELNESLADQKEKLARLKADLAQAMSSGINQTDLARARNLHQRLQNATTDAERAALGQELDSMNPAVQKALELERQIQNTERSNRSLQASLRDVNEKIAENTRQMRDGLDSTKERQEKIQGMTNALQENEKKLSDYNTTERNLRVSELQAQISHLTQEMADNTGKLNEAAGAQELLNKARENARLITVRMTEADKEQALQTIFGARGIKEASILMASGVDGFKKLETQMIQNGRVNQVAIAMQKGLKGQLEGLKSTVENLALTVGNVLMPKAKQFVGWLTDLVQRIQSGNPHLIQMGVRIAAVAAAIGPALGILGTAAVVIARIGSLFTPVGWAITIATGLIAAFAYAWSHNLGDIQGRVKAFMDFLKPRWQQFMTDLNGLVQTYWPLIKKAFSDFLVWITPALRQSFEAAKAVTDNVFRGLHIVMTQWIPKVMEGIGKFVDWIGPKLKAAWDTISKDIKPAWDEISRFLTDVWPVVSRVIEGQIQIIATSLRMLARLFAGTWDGISQTLSGAWKVLTGLVKIGWSTLAGVITVGLDLLRGDWKKAWADVQHYGKIGMDGIKDLLGGLVDTTIGTMRTLAQMLVNAGRDLIHGLMLGIQGSLPDLSKAVQGVGDTVIQTLRDVLGWHSPSTVFMQAGVDSAQGYINGLNQMMNPVKGAVNSLFNANGTLTEAGQQAQAEINNRMSLVTALYQQANALKAQFPDLGGSFVHNAPASGVNPVENLAKQILSGATGYQLPQYNADGSYKLLRSQGGALPGTSGASAGSASVGGGSVNVTQNIYGDVNNEADEKRIVDKIAQSLQRTLRFASG